MHVMNKNLTKTAVLLRDNLKNGLASSNDKVGWQFFRYLCTGGSAALVDWFIFWLLIALFDVHYLISAFISFSVATLVNYYLSANWVFLNSRKYGHTAELFLVFLVSLIGLLINQACLYLLIEIGLLHYMLAKIISTGVVFFWNFFLRKYYIFNHRVKL